MKILDELRVGDIVICHGWDKVEGKKGFIQEIVTDPNLQVIYHRFHSGRYSVYGLEPAKFSSGASLYYGDFFGEELESTGNFMNIEDLEKFRLNEPDNKGLQNDITTIIKNLRRKSGRNI